MPAQRMPDAQCSAQSQLSRDHRGLLAKLPPIISLQIFVAPPMASRIDRIALPIRKLLDNLIPDSSVKTGGMGEQNPRTFAPRLPNRKMVNATQLHEQ